MSGGRAELALCRRRLNFRQRARFPSLYRFFAILKTKLKTELQRPAARTARVASSAAVLAPPGNNGRNVGRNLGLHAPLASRLRPAGFGQQALAAQALANQ